MNWYKFLTETNKIHNDERPGDLMDKLFINWPNILKLIIILYRYHICTYNCKKNVDLKNEFLRFYFWRFIEVKWTITMLGSYELV
jgi:hypothetical protein